MANITAITSKYVPQYVGGIDKEVNSLLKDYQTRQDTVLNSANELNDSFGIASSQLDATDRESFNKYTAGIKENLKKYTENDYVGNLDRKITHDSNQFKSIYNVFQDNTKRKQKFIDDISKSGLSQEKQQKYLDLANKKNGSLQYDPITQGVTNRFSPIEVIKNPDVNKMINLLDNQIPTVEGVDYMSPDGKKISKVPRPELGYYERKYKKKVIDNSTVANINNKLSTDPEYNSFYQRNVELGGKEYAKQEHDRTLQSIVSGLKVGEFNTESLKTDDMVEYSMKQDIQERTAKKQEKDLKIAADSMLPTPINQKMSNFENLADLNTELTLATKDGDKEKMANLSAYINKFEKQFGITYGKDYEQLNLGVGKTQRILNDTKKHLVEQGSALVKEDAIPTTSFYKNHSFKTEAELKLMDRGFQQTMGNLTSTSSSFNPFGAKTKTNAMYTPINGNTGKALTIDEMKYMKNVQFGGTTLTSHGVYFNGRSNGSSKEQEGQSSDSDFNFLIKVPHQEQILSNLEQLHSITPGQKRAYLKLQGLDDNYGNFKKIQTQGKDLYVKKILPSDRSELIRNNTIKKDDDVQYLVKNSHGTTGVKSFEDLVDYLGKSEEK